MSKHDQAGKAVEDITRLAATPEETRTLLEHQLDMLWSQPGRARQVAPMMLWGAPGVGKSSIVRGLCEALDIGFIDIRLAQMDPVDIRGLPVPRDGMVDWLLSSQWPRDPASRGIILFDEITAVDRSLQVAVYEMILDRRLGTLYEVPPGWLLVAAGNRGGDQAVVTTMSSALANRFCHLEVQPQLEDWLKWAGAAGIHPNVTGFLRFRPECFHDMEGDLERGWPSARSWERVSEVLHQGKLSDRLLELMLGGLVGPGAGRELAAFLDWAGKLPDAEMLLQDPESFQMPRRADQRYALCAALVHFLWSGPTDGLEARVDGFLRIGLKMTSDFAAMAMIDALSAASRRPEGLGLLLDHSLYERWTQRHGQAFRRHQPGLAA
ncbi:MAG: AAA family ATPase [Wenzhouxiangella sp.]|nr:MAG: AAA family ATPase [Wenzhouxiangella sp.]